MQQLSWYWQALWVLTSGWAVRLLSSSPLFACFLLAFQGDCQSQVSTRPFSPGGQCPCDKLTRLLFSLCCAPFNPRLWEPFRWIDFLHRCNIHYGLQYIVLSESWKYYYSVTFVRYVCSYWLTVAGTDMGRYCEVSERTWTSYCISTRHWLNVFASRFFKLFVIFFD